MKNAIRVGTAAGIGVYVHWTFVVLILGLFGFYYYHSGSAAAAANGIAGVVVLFLCVVLHEFGHALAARRYGVATRDITLYPIGGVARLEGLPENPGHELWIALAGPAVNLVIALVIGAALLGSGRPIVLDALSNPEATFWDRTLFANLILVGFNLLPAFPMDGGRVLRSLLASRMAFARATEIAANVGQGMAIIFGFLGVFTGNFVLLFIALFVYIGAQQEARQATMRSLTDGISVRDAMMTRFRILAPTDTIDRAVQELLAGSDQEFPVLDGDRIVGILTRKEMLRALAEQGREAMVGHAVQSDCIFVEESASLDEAFGYMQANNCTAAPVVQDGRLVGVLTLENVGELLMISSATREDAPPLWEKHG